MSYTCVECYISFDEPKEFCESHGENYDACPTCGGDYRQSRFCDACARRMTNDYIKTTAGHRFCGRCYVEIGFGYED